MSEKQLLHELNASREATEQIRNDIQKAKQKGYFSSTDFGRDFVSTLTTDFGQALVNSTGETARGRATTTNIAIAYKSMQEVLSLVEPNIVSVISLKSILDSFGVCKYDKPRTAEAAALLGRRIEDEVRVNYYTQLAPDDVVKAQIKELNTSGSSPHFRRYGAKKTVEKLLKERGWKDDDLYPSWSLEERSRIGLFILDVAKKLELIAITKKQISPKRSQNFLDLSPTLEAQFKIYQAQLEKYSVKSYPLIDTPKDWEVLDGASRRNFSGGYHHEWIRKLFPLCRSYQSNSQFGKEAVNLLNTLNKVAWKIDSEILTIAEKMLLSGFSIGALNAVIRDPRLDMAIPERIKGLSPKDPERIDWRKMRAQLHTAHADSKKKSIRSRQIIHLARKFQKESKFYLSWSCDYRGRMYSQQSFLHPQSSDLERAIITFSDGCKLDKQGESYAAQALGSAFIGSKASYEERGRWTYDNKELIKAITDNPIGMSTSWECANEPWQFLQLALEWNQVVVQGTKNLWNVPIGADSTASGLQLLSGMRRDTKGMKFSNLTAPEKPNDPPKDAYQEVLKIARELANKDKETQWLTEYLVKRDLGKPIVMKALYGASLQTNRSDIKEFFIKENLFPDVITYQDVLTITTLITKASKQVFPMAFESLEWIKKLFVQAKKNGSTSIKWTTPNQDIIHLSENKIEVVDVRTTHLGKVRLGLGQGKEPNFNAMKKALAPSFVHSYDAAVLKSSFQDWMQPIALIHDCLKVLPNDMDKAKERIRHGFVHACSGDPLSKLADDLNIQPEQLPRLRQGSGDLLEVFKSSYMFN